MPSGRSLPAAFDRETGEFRYKKSYGWRSSAGGVVGGSRAILADGQLYSSGAHHFLALDQESGNAGHALLQIEAVAPVEAGIDTGPAVGLDLGQPGHQGVPVR